MKPRSLAEVMEQKSPEEFVSGVVTAFNIERMRGTCCVCGCTEDRPCPGGCSWTDPEKTLCSRCNSELREAATRAGRI
jgi:hypothetical protein